MGFDGHAVAPDRGFGFGAAEDIVVDVLVQVVLRRLGEFMQDLELLNDLRGQVLLFVSHEVSSPIR